MTAPTYRGSQQSGNAAGASVNPLAVSWSSITGLAVGDLMVMEVAWGFNGTTITTPTGWTAKDTPTGSSGNQYRKYFKYAASGDLTTTSINVSFSANAVSIATVHVWTGACTLGTTVFGTLNSLTMPSVASTQADSDYLTSAGTSVASSTPGTLTFTNGTVTQNPATARASGSNQRLTSSRLTSTGTGTFTAGTATVTGTAAATVQSAITEIKSVGSTAGTVTYTMAGAARSDRVILLAKTSGATSVRFGVSTSSSMTSPSYSTAAAPDSNNEYRVDFTGLSANTLYYYRLYDTPSGGSETDIGSGLGSTTSGSFRTRTSAAGTSDVKVALGSCCLTATAQSAVAFDDVVTWDPHFVLHLGDAYYNGNSANTLASQHRTLWETQVGAVAKWKAMLGGTAVDYINSDHELNPDDADTNTTNASSFNDFYKATIPARLVDTATSPAGKYRSWIDSGIRFILLDIRNTDRSPGANTDNSSKTMLGTTQKAWLKNELIDSDGTTTYLKVIISDVPWMGTATLANGADKWWAYDTERTEIATYITSRGIGVDFLHGDSHRVAVDRTHNSWGGFPVICGSPFSQNGGGAETNGTWDAFYDNSGAAVSQYQRLTYSWPQTNVVRRVASGWDAIAATQRVSQTAEWGTATGSLATTVTLSAAVVEREIATGNLTVTAALSAAAVEVEVATGTLATTAALSGAVVEREITTGNLAVTTTLTGTSVEVEQATGNLAVTAALSGAVVEREITTGNLAVTAALSGDAFATGGTPTVTGNLPITATLSGAASGFGGIVTRTGNLAVTAALSSTSIGVGVTTGNLASTATLSAATVEREQATGNLAATVTFSAAAVAHHIVTGNLDGGTVTLAAQNVAVAVVTGQLLATAGLSAVAIPVGGDDGIPVEDPRVTITSATGAVAITTPTPALVLNGA